MPVKPKKKNALHSGIGDRLDLLVKTPSSEEVWEDFQYATRLRGKKKHSAEIYPEVNFEYGIHYKGKLLETYNEKPYDFDIHCHPERCLEYDIEERRYLCYDRLWEVKAYFEAEVRRMTVEYAIKWKAEREYWVQDTVDYKICWTGEGKIDKKHNFKYAARWAGTVTTKDQGDMKSLFTNANADALKIGAGLGNWHISGGDVRDVTNTPTFSGIAHKDYLKWNEYEATFDFTPIPESGSKNAKKRSGNTVVTSPGYDDDCVGVIFKVQDKNNFYVMMWENEERAYIQNATRTANNLEGLKINSNATRSVSGFGSGWKEFTARALEQGAYAPGSLTGSTMNNYERTKGWGTQHRRIYRVVNGKMYRVDTSSRGPSNSGSRRDGSCKDLGNGNGWKMNSRHSVRIVSLGKRVKIQVKYPNQSSYQTIFDFNTAYERGSFGALNVSQAVKFHQIVVQEKTTLKGRRPINESQWETHSGERKDLGTATEWLKDSIKNELSKKGLSTNLYSSINFSSIKGETSTPGKGTIKTPKSGSGHIYVTAGTYKVTVGLSGCIPEKGWHQSSVPNINLGDKDAYIRSNSSFVKKAKKAGLDPGKVTIKKITSSVKDPTLGRVTIGAKNIIVYANKHKEYEYASGRIPENPNTWFKFDGIGQHEHSPNAEKYIKGNTISPFVGFDWDDPTVKITFIGGEVKPDPTVTVSPKHSPRPDNITGWIDKSFKPLSSPIIVYSNNPADAGQIYSTVHYKCGIATVCPDNLDKESGAVVIGDVRELFREEDDAFFNRPDYINKKREYTLLIPDPAAQIEDPESQPETMGGCVLPEDEEPEEKECRPDIDDFSWDGIRLIMWTCKPPVNYITRHYKACVYAYEGEMTFAPLDLFEKPNPWTSYRLIPIEETIEDLYDYLEWSRKPLNTNTPNPYDPDGIEWRPPGTKIKAKTTRYFIARWEGPYEGRNKGIAKSTSLVNREIPAAPEYYKDPVTGEAMFHGYENLKFVLESNVAFKKETDISMWWKSKPTVTTKNVNRKEENINVITGTPIMRAFEMDDEIIIKCMEDPRLLNWTSGKYIGYGKVNGKEPLYANGSGKADMIDVPTRVVYFPSNLVSETLTGPFVDVYVDRSIYKESVKIEYQLSEDKLFVNFSSDYLDFYYWYTDWYTDWKIDNRIFKATKGLPTIIEDAIFPNPVEDSSYQKDSTFIQSMESISNNPFVKVWADPLTQEQIDQLESGTPPQSLPKIYGQVKEARPMPWSPMIHNGYFYFQDKENFLHAQAKLMKVAPNENHEIIIEPRPQQAGAIIVRDGKGNNLRKVTFYDKDFNLTLENTEVFHGNGYAMYYLSYKGIDKNTLVVKVNEEDIPYIFNDELSRVEFMYPISMEDIIEVKYKLLYSYILDMNYSVEKDQAKISLHDNYDPALMYDLEIIYEEAMNTPFYRASELAFNSLLNHNHSGFLYISEIGEQDVKDVTVNITPKNLEAIPNRKALITAKIIDELGNPVPNKKVTLYRNSIVVEDPSFNYVTNEAGEVYFYFSPIRNERDIPSSKVDEYVVECDGKSDRILLNYYVKNRTTRRYVEIQKSKSTIMGGVSDKSTVSISVRDELFNKLTSEPVSIEITNTRGVKDTQIAYIPASGILTLDIDGTNEKQGTIYVKVSYDMGFENAVNYTYVKVIGG